MRTKEKEVSNLEQTKEKWNYFNKTDVFNSFVPDNVQMESQKVRD